MFKKDLDNGELEWEHVIDMYPTRQEMIDLDNWTKDHRKNAELFDKLRFEFDDENDFELFKISLLKDSSVLKKYMPEEDIAGFYDFVKMRKLNTTGKGKLLNYFKDILKSERFQEDVRELRVKHKIPERGFPYVEENEGMFDTDSVFYNDINDLAGFYKLYDRAWYSLFKHYVVFNSSDLRELPYFSFDFDLCSLEAIEGDREGLTMKDLEFPISIRISPYASLRDIADYIKKNSKMIEDKLKAYRANYIKIGRVKKKKTAIQERNDFIYEHRHLKRREIMSLLGDKFGKGQIIDYGYIGKIISLEKKKRKEL